MPKFTVKTKRLMVLGIVLLALVGALVGKYEAIPMAITGFFALMQDKDDNDVDLR